MDERAMKPCPFCGGEAKIMNLNHGTWVECSNYHYERHQVCVHAKTEAEAIAAWNSRAELESGTCNPVETEVITYYDEYGHDAVKVHVMECDECGGTYEHINGDYERCPRCGKTVRR